MCYNHSMDNFYVYEKTGCLRAVYKGKSRVSFFRLFPGILLSYNEIKTKDIPSDSFAPLFTSKVFMRVNFSLVGICEVRMCGGNDIYVKGGTMAISRNDSPKTFSYPSDSYTGIELYVETEALDQMPEEFTRFGVHPEKIERLYLSHQDTLLTDRWDKLCPIAQSLSELLNLDSPDIEQLRLYSLLIFRTLSTGEAKLENIPVSALTSRQIECAKSAERLLTKNLSRRITIPEIAKQLDVGDSSLKNWFRYVFGKSISDYVRDSRIREAKQLLSSSALSIVDIAARVGYENQAKFTAMFHKYCGYTPSIYRKQQRRQCGSPE